MYTMLQRADHINALTLTNLTLTTTIQATSTYCTLWRIIMGTLLEQGVQSWRAPEYCPRAFFCIIKHLASIVWLHTLFPIVQITSYSLYLCEHDFDAACSLCCAVHSWQTDRHTCRASASSDSPYSHFNRFIVVDTLTVAHTYSYRVSRLVAHTYSYRVSRLVAHTYSYRVSRLVAHTYSYRVSRLVAHTYSYRVSRLVAHTYSYRVSRLVAHTYSYRVSRLVAHTYCYRVSRLVAHTYCYRVSRLVAHTYSYHVSRLVAHTYCYRVSRLVAHTYCYRVSRLVAHTYCYHVSRLVAHTYCYRVSRLADTYNSNSSFHCNIPVPL